MLLSIIIPQYKETETRIKPLLLSIDMQRGINFNDIEVIIVNDGSDTILSDDFLDSFTNYKPTYLKLPENKGPGLCRQYGLDRAQGDYVTFCDADDTYHSIGVLSYYLSTIRANDFEILRAAWLEELNINGWSYLTHAHENTWLHGKVFSRKFLVYNNIRFSDELLYHEDSYFNSNAAAMVTPNKVLESDVITYMWTWDTGTITRRNNGAYGYESMEEFTHAIRLSCRWIKGRRPELVPEKVVQCLAYVFYCVTNGEQNSWKEEYVQNTKHEMYEMYTEFKTEFESVPAWRRAQIDLEERRKITETQPYIPTVTFAEFMTELETAFTA